MCGCVVYYRWSFSITPGCCEYGTGISIIYTDLQNRYSIFIFLFHFVLVEPVTIFCTYLPHSPLTLKKYLLKSLGPSAISSGWEISTLWELCPHHLGSDVARCLKRLLRIPAQNQYSWLGRVKCLLCLALMFHWCSSGLFRHVTHRIPCLAQAETCLS